MNLQKITVKDGKVTLGSNGLKQIIRSLDDGEWMVKIEQYKEKRRLRQNNLYWKWLEVIGEHLGYYKDELHEEFISQFADVYTIRGLDGKPKQKRLRTSKMNIEQMTRYMERIDQFAAEQNINLPRPQSLHP